MAIYYFLTKSFIWKTWFYLLKWCIIFICNFYSQLVMYSQRKNWLINFHLVSLPISRNLVLRYLTFLFPVRHQKIRYEFYLPMKSIAICLFSRYFVFTNLFLRKIDNSVFSYIRDLTDWLCQKSVYFYCLLAYFILSIHFPSQNKWQAGLLSMNLLLTHILFL